MLFTIVLGEVSVIYFLACVYDDYWYDMEYKDVEKCILDIAKSKLGELYQGGLCVKKETWWWIARPDT